MIPSTLPLRDDIANCKRVPSRYRKQLLRQHDFVLLAIVDLCRSQPDWSAGRVSAALQGTCPGLQERIVAELRKVVGAKHAKRRGGARTASGPACERLRVEIGGSVIGAWYAPRRANDGTTPRQFVSVELGPDGEMLVGYRMPDDERVFTTSYRTWARWRSVRLDPPAAGCRTVPEMGLSLVNAAEEAVA